MSEPFNKVEMMVLAKLSYFKAPGVYDSDGTAVAPCSLYEMLETYKTDLVKEFDAKTVSNLMDKVENKNYTVVKAVDNTYASGFEAIAIEGPDSKTVTVAARGSEGFEEGKITSYEDLVQDWGFADVIGLGLQSESQQHKDMNSFMKDLDKYNSIYLTGHSLGGNLAVNGAVCFEDPDKIKGVYTYNAPGQNASYMATHALQILRVKDKIKNYQTEGDWVSDINTPIGDVIVVKSKRKESLDHLLGNFSIEGDSDFDTKKTNIIITGKNGWHTISNIFFDHITVPWSLAVLLLKKYFQQNNPWSNIIDNGKIYNWINEQYQNAVNAINGRNDLIFINTNGLNDEANKLRNYQQEYAQLVQRMSNLIITLRQDHVWDTSATESFISSYLEIKKVFDKFSEIMTEYAVILDGVSNRMLTADNSMAAKFNNLSL